MSKSRLQDELKKKRPFELAEQEAIRKEKSTRCGREEHWLDWKNGCRYHEHANGGKCYKEKRKHLYV